MRNVFQIAFVTCLMLVSYILMWHIKYLFGFFSVFHWFFCFVYDDVFWFSHVWWCNSCSCFVWFPGCRTFPKEFSIKDKFLHSQENAGLPNSYRPKTPYSFPHHNRICHHFHCASLTRQRYCRLHDRSCRRWRRLRRRHRQRAEIVNSSYKNLLSLRLRTSARSIFISDWG